MIYYFLPEKNSGSTSIEESSLGSSKEINSRLSALDQSHINYFIVKIPYRSNRSAIKHILAMRKKFVEQDVFIFDYSKFVVSALFIRLLSFKVKIICRQHNLEVLHELERLICFFKIAEDYSFKRFLMSFLKALKNLVFDFLGRFVFDLVLIPNETEVFYWRRIFGHKMRVVNVFVSPQVGIQFPATNREGFAFGERWANKRRVLIVGSSLPTPFSDESIKAMVDSEFFRVNSDVTFFLSGNFSIALPRIANLKPVGVVSDYERLINCFDVVAVTGGYGLGFKTRILELLSAGKAVFVHHRIVPRIPLVLREFVFSIEEFNCFEPNDVNLERQIQACRTYVDEARASWCSAVIEMVDARS